MATKRPSLKNILAQSLEQVNTYKEPQLREIVKMMNKEVSKRLERLENFERETQYFEDGVLTGGSTAPALHRIRDSGGTRESENFQKLRNDFKRAYNFLNDPTSKITAWKQIRKNLKDKFIEYTGLDTHRYKWVDKFFNVYNKYKEIPEGGYNAYVMSYGSEQAFRDAAQVYQQILDKGYYDFTTKGETDRTYIDNQEYIQQLFFDAMEDMYRYNTKNN